MARSGSTLLARELDALSNVAVTIEEDIPDGIVKGHPVELHNEKEVDQYLDEIFQGEKLRSWNVQRESLKTEIFRHTNYPVHYDHVLRSLHALYFARHDSSVVVHKKGSYYRAIERVRELFADAKFIHVVRDPRAVYNSQKKSRDSFTGKPMTTKLLTFCFRYKHAMRLTRKHKGHNYFYELRYEDIIDQRNEAIARLAGFMNVEGLSEQEDTSYYSRIPDKQKALHANVREHIVSERKHAWKSELKAREIFLLQTLLKKEMREKGYTPDTISFWKLRRKGSVLGTLLIFYSKNAFKTCFPLWYNKLKRLTLPKSIAK
jgi:predicted transposase YbfD/YdcC